MGNPRIAKANGGHKRQPMRGPMVVTFHQPVTPRRVRPRAWEMPEPRLTGELLLAGLKEGA